MPSPSPLPETWRVPQVFRSRLGEHAGRQRTMFADGHLLLVLHAPPRRDEAKRAARLFTRAAKLYEPKCRGAEPQLCSRLADLELSGLGLKQDPSHATDLFKRACDAQDELGCWRHRRLMAKPK